VPAPNPLGTQINNRYRAIQRSIRNEPELETLVGENYLFYCFRNQEQCLRILQEAEFYLESKGINVPGNTIINNNDDDDDD